MQSNIQKKHSDDEIEVKKKKKVKFKAPKIPDDHHDEEHRGRTIETFVGNGTRKDSVSNTLIFSIRRSRLNKENNIEGKRTSFLELFFDLAVVFVFALVASGFAKAWHVDAETLLGDTHGEEVSNIGISVFYWMASFLSLWMTWHQYNIYVRYYGKNNLSTHLLTFLLIIGVIAQGMAKIVSYRWFHIYALSLSFLFNRCVLLIWMWISVDKRPLEPAEAYRYNVLKKQTWGFVLYFASIIAFVVCASNGSLIADDSEDFIWVYLWAAIFITVASIFELMVEFINKRNKNPKVNKYESVIFHNKERHHLFLIITFGELLVINLTTGTEFVNLYATLIPTLIINLIITMIIWYIYKTFIFAPEYKLNYRNRVVFTFVHILVIASLTVILSSLETYSIAIHELKTTEIKDGFNIGMKDLKLAVDVIYPLIFLGGYVVLISSITMIVVLSDYKNGTYENSIRNAKTRFILLMSIPVGVALIMMILVLCGIIIPWIAIEGAILLTTAGSMFVSIFMINRYLLKHHKPEDVEELLEEIHG